ncbi:hypothetical protein GCE86_07155 [Micromonospora terminaliae]|uniref:NACHT domain-containing protein n=1 Tax=Micromonospora terminaliae TaxID=1914461 RepID=A0AAJ3DL48_9ACTN|nr:hypothetical protein [Micromonospora terminaliae]NES29973.1 hypothetical protein [Micromonospora terminaliae]QGL46851.1 hypothetical protein GCE86_07155 [Micromonospora terminaliae]
MTPTEGRHIDAHAADQAQQINIVGEVGAVNVRSPDPTFDRLRTKIGSAIAVQSNALTNRGLLTVPWLQEPRRDGARQPDLADETALVRFVASGNGLLILGRSQSGKTTLSTRLAVLLAAESRKLPVIFPLAGWCAERTPLMDWMIDVIRQDYGVRDGPRLEAARDAIEGAVVIPIFDGFDEIEESSRAAAAREIDVFWRGRAVVLTSIPVDGGVTPRAALRHAEVVTLAPVEPDEVGRYLLDDVQSSERAQWEDVVRRVTSDADSPVSVALSSPLMSWLAKSIYDPSEAERNRAPHPSPIELLRADLGTSEAIEEHLLGGLVRSVFPRTAISRRSSGSPASAFAVSDAERWLHHLSRRAGSRGVIAFWEIRRYAPLNRLGLLPATATGALIGAAGHVIPEVVGPAFFLLWAGLFFGFGFARGYATGRTMDSDDVIRPGFELDADQRERLARGARPAVLPKIQKDGDLRHHATRLLAALPFVVLSYGGCLLAVSTTATQPAWRFSLGPVDFWVGMILATVVAPLVGFLGALVAARLLRANSRLDSGTGARATDPLEAIHGDRRSGIGMLVLATGTLGAGYLMYYAVLLPGEAAWGLLAAPAGGLVAMLYWNVWVRYKTAHLWLACWDRLPWRLVTFLRACHQGGILRKQGNYFEFRHQRLRKRLAAVEPQAW